MSKRILILLSLILTSWVSAQDVYIANVDVDTRPSVVDGGTVQFSFSTGNRGSQPIDGFLTAPNLALDLTLTISDGELTDMNNIANSISGTVSDRFDWSYYIANGMVVVRGIQNTVFAAVDIHDPTNIDGGTIVVDVVNTAPSIEGNAHFGMVAQANLMGDSFVNNQSGSTFIFTTPAEEKLACTAHPLIVGSPAITQTGISTLDNPPIDGWPDTVRNGFVVLESNDKGLVVTRHANPNLAIANPVEGMLAYNTTEKCLQLFKNAVWNCISQDTCEDDPNEGVITNPDNIITCGLVQTNTATYPYGYTAGSPDQPTGNYYADVFFQNGSTEDFSFSTSEEIVMWEGLGLRAVLQPINGSLEIPAGSFNMFHVVLKGNATAPPGVYDTPAMKFLKDGDIVCPAAPDLSIQIN